MSFDEFVAAVASIPDSDADGHFRSQYTFVTNRAGDIGIDFVGRYESLLSDFQVVRRRIALPHIELPRLQAAREPVNYGTYYTPKTREIVANRFRKDIQIFGYEFGAQ